MTLWENIIFEENLILKKNIPLSETTFLYLHVIHDFY